MLTSSTPFVSCPATTAQSSRPPNTQPDPCEFPDLITNISIDDEATFTGVFIRGAENTINLQQRAPGFWDLDAESPITLSQDGERLRVVTGDSSTQLTVSQSDTVAGGRLQVTPYFNFQAFRGVPPLSTGLSWFFHGQNVPHNVCGFELITNDSSARPGILRNVWFISDIALTSDWTLQLYRDPVSGSRVLVDQWLLPLGSRRYRFMGLTNEITLAEYGFCLLGSGNSPSFSTAAMGWAIETIPYN